MSSSTTLEVLSSVVLEVLSSDTVEEVLVVEVLEVVLPELEVSPEQAAMLATITRAIIAIITFFIMSFPFKKMRFALAASWLPLRIQAEQIHLIHGTQSKSNTLQRNYGILYEFLTNHGMIINKVFIIQLCRKTETPRISKDIQIDRAKQ